MGSPLKTVGVINADVSTGIAGWLEHGRPAAAEHGRRPRRGESAPSTLRWCAQPSLLASLVFSVLTNSVDMEGQLPDELTADFVCRIEVEGTRPGRDPGHLLGRPATRAAQA